MSFSKQLIVLLLLGQLFTSCWTRSQYEADKWSAPLSYWTNLEESDSSDNQKISSKNNHHNANNFNENDLLDKFLPVSFKAKKALRGGSHANMDDRRKKFLAESVNLQDGQSLQGLWALPGRR